MPELSLPGQTAHVHPDRADYDRFLAEFGLTAAWVAQVAANPHDQIPMPDGCCAQVAPSAIDGLGLFATAALAPGQTAAPARRGGCRTPAGRYANHAASPNAVAVARSSGACPDIDFVARRAIAAGEEITLDYRQALRANPGLTAAVPGSAARRDAITDLVAALMAHGERASPPLKHTLCDGMYMRELFIPAGMLLAGKVHKVACLNICSAGDIEIVTEHGMLRAGGGFTAASPAFTQKLGYAYADTVWVNVFRTDLTDLAAIERALFMDDDETIAHLDPEGRHFGDFLRLRGTP
jgi:hypothetical protein